MNSTSKIDQSYQQTTNWSEQTFEKEFESYDIYLGRNEKEIIQIKISSDQTIVYLKNGAILRRVECHDILEKPEIFNNLCQIFSLSWKGQYGKNNKKSGKWIAVWDSWLQKNVGGYYKDGQKQGLWKDLFVNYQSQLRIFEIGEYNNGLKIGRWNYIYERAKIGCGVYKKDGLKQGKWIELDESFHFTKQVTFKGEYNMNGMKVGIWDTMYCKEGEEEYKQIGGGSYDQEGNQQKIGKWIELDEGFCCGEYYSKQVTYNGEYNMNNRKIGRWDIMYCKEGEEEYKQIGGGSYDQEGNQQKLGKWVELFEEFRNNAQIYYNGEYNMNGMKVGIWDTMYCKEGEEEYKQIGGGTYDQEGNQQKIGKWIELDKYFVNGKYVTYNGEYNMNNMKVGRWDIMFDKDGDGKYKKIGGGLYDQEGTQKKVGDWAELNQYFDKWNQAIYYGQYNLQGQKVGLWVQIDELSGNQFWQQRYGKN